MNSANFSFTSLWIKALLVFCNSYRRSVDRKNSTQSEYGLSDPIAGGQALIEVTRSVVFIHSACFSYWIVKGINSSVQRSAKLCIQLFGFPSPVPLMKGDQIYPADVLLNPSSRSLHKYKHKYDALHIKWGLSNPRYWILKSFLNLNSLQPLWVLQARLASFFLHHIGLWD